MLKRGLVFTAFLGFSAYFFTIGVNLSLAYYVLFPAILFPLFYFYNHGNKVLLALTALLSIALFMIGGIRHGWAELVIIGLEIVIVFIILAFYREHWKDQIKKAEGLLTSSADDLEVLKQKHETRLNSLKRLEKQVSSLMELFDIARVFSDALSFESLAGHLQSKIMPELQCRKMDFVTVDESGEKIALLRHFRIEPKSVREEDPDFTPEQTEKIDLVFKTKKMQKFELSERSDQDLREQWIFPMVIDGKISAILIVEGARDEDFVRFEVLVAHLVLQVKKIMLYETVKELSIIDGLTEVYVRRHFLERFKEETERSLKFKLPFSVLLLDIDHFKSYNDKFGHLVGDATLKEVSRLIRESLRKVDLVARYGGEEFIALLPETGREGAIEVAERIRSNIARHRFQLFDVEASVTVSIGVSAFPDDLPAQWKDKYYSDLEIDLIRFADKALYRAKEEGRNQVFSYKNL